MLFFACCLAMLFFACLLAMLFLRRLFGSACACHPRQLPVVTQRLCCSSPSSVSLGGPPDCNANSLFQVVPLVVLFSLRVSSALVFCLLEFDPLGSVVQVTVVLRHRAVLDNLTFPLSVFFSITGSSGCDSFSVLSSSDVASCERRVPRAPRCGSLRQCDRQSGTVQRHLLGTAPLRDRWFAVGTLASLCGSLQQRGPLSLRKFSLSGLGTALPRCGLGASNVSWFAVRPPAPLCGTVVFTLLHVLSVSARCYMSFNCFAECFSLLLHAGVPTL